MIASIHIRTIANALEIAGHPATLAEALGVSIAELRCWYGEVEIPASVFLRLIDIVAYGRVPPIVGS